MKRKKAPGVEAAILGPEVGKTVKKATDALTTAGIEHAVVGGLALGARGYRRFTADVDLLVDPEKVKEARKALRAVGIVRAGGFYDDLLSQLADRNGIGVDLLFGAEDPEESARVMATVASVEGVRVRTARPEYLVWMYLLSDRAQHEVDAIELIARKRVNLKKLDRILELAGMRRALHPRLQLFVLRAQAQAARGR